MRNLSAAPEQNPVSPFFECLQQETQSARTTFLQIEQLVRGARGDISPRTYMAFLGEAYHHVRHTVPLLMACGSRLDAEKEWLRTAVAEYIEEETGHQQWILNDLHACGGDPQAYRDRTPNPETELMVAYAYDTIHRGNPVGFFGMVLVLEGTSIRLATHAAATIQASLGLPDAAFSYLNSHGSLDIDHIKFLESLMNRIDDPNDQQAIVHMANMMYRLYGDVFRSLPLDP